MLRTAAPLSVAAFMAALVWMSRTSLLQETPPLQEQPAPWAWTEPTQTVWPTTPHTPAAATNSRPAAPLMNPLQPKEAPTPTPAAVLAAYDKLKLTPQQIQQLQQIEWESQQKTVAVLTPQQQAALAKLDQ